MTDDERHRQMVSFAYGNVAMENQRVTRAQVEWSFGSGAGIGTRASRGMR